MDYFCRGRISLKTVQPVRTIIKATLVRAWAVLEASHDPHETPELLSIFLGEDLGSTECSAVLRYLSKAVSSLGSLDSDGKMFLWPCSSPTQCMCFQHRKVHGNYTLRFQSTLCTLLRDRRPRSHLSGRQWKQLCMLCVRSNECISRQPLANPSNTSTSAKTSWNGSVDRHRSAQRIQRAV